MLMMTEAFNRNVSKTVSILLILNFAPAWYSFIVVQCTTKMVVVHSCRRKLYQAVPSWSKYQETVLLILLLNASVINYMTI